VNKSILVSLISAETVFAFHRKVSELGRLKDQNHPYECEIRLFSFPQKFFGLHRYLHNASISMRFLGPRNKQMPSIHTQEVTSNHAVSIASTTSTKTKSATNKFPTSEKQLTPIRLTRLNTKDENSFRACGVFGLPSRNATGSIKTVC
jgi:hypothetical protein